MQKWNFKALVLCSEINLNKIASYFGITAKFKWEDPLILHGKYLNGVIKNESNKWVYMYSFGSMVFINLEFHEIQDVIKYVKNTDPALKNNNPDEYIDQYNLEVDPSYELTLYNDSMTVNEFKDYHLDIISIVLAKSTSLRKIETDIDKLLDNIEDVMNDLDNGRYDISDKQIAKTSSKILRFKYNTISYLMLLDKPKAAWNNEDIESFFLALNKLFEINDRYSKITHKTEILQDITEVFSSLTHEKRGTRLEIAVIILIFTELVISLIPFISNFFK